MTEDSNEIDTMFVDKRGNQTVNGTTLVRLGVVAF